MNGQGLEVLAAFAVSLAAPGERWVQLGGSGGAYQDYLDQESVKCSGGKVHLWTRRDFADKRRTAWHEIEIDCAAKRDTILAYVEDVAGTVSHNTVRPHRASAPIAPGSVGEKIFKRVCRR